MTDNEIIKALEYCMTDKPCAENNCPFYGTACVNDLHAPERYALALITRQKAEIERLVEHTKEGIDLAKQLPEMLKLAQAEAIQEFAERLTAELIEGGIYPAFVKGKIEKVKKEMEGDV